MVAHLRQAFADIPCQKSEIRNKIFRLAFETLAQFRILRCNADRTGILVAAAAHNAALSNHNSSTESIFLCTKQRHKHHVS